uniref:Uncharacterized protein n=1 Tax=Ditylenchus dipsaci TaxID=166011 RepID=A0A915DJH5_9BILA
MAFWRRSPVATRILDCGTSKKRSIASLGWTRLVDYFVSIRQFRWTMTVNKDQLFSTSSDLKKILLTTKKDDTGRK